MTTTIRIPHVIIEDNSSIASNGLSSSPETAPVSPSLSSSSMGSRSSLGQEYVQSKNATRVRFSRKVRKYSYRSAQFINPKPTTTDELWEQCISKAQDLMKSSASLKTFITKDDTSNDKVAMEVAKVIYAKEIHKSSIARS